MRRIALQVNGSMPFQEFTLVASTHRYVLHKHTGPFSQGNFLLILITLLTARYSAGILGWGEGQGFNGRAKLLELMSNFRR
jgi:hypothetical protein